MKKCFCLVVLKQYHREMYRNFPIVYEHIKNKALSHSDVKEWFHRQGLDEASSKPS